MRIYYWQSATGNFGDDLNLWLWPRLLGRDPTQIGGDDNLFVGIGSLLNTNLDRVPGRKIVCGAGAGYGPPPRITEQWRIYWVRGPRTARLLKISPRCAILDPAVLVREYIRASPHRSLLSFMPHHRSAELFPWEYVCRAIGISYIDPRTDVSRTLEHIAQSRLIISEALHGCIVADALGIPWVAVCSRDRGKHNFKWCDWGDSLGFRVHRYPLAPLYSKGKRAVVSFAGVLINILLLRALASKRGHLSPRDVFHERYYALKRQVELLCSELC